MVSITTRGPAPISRVMIFIDGHYLEKNIADRSDRKINYSNFANHLISHSNFGIPALKRVYFYDGLPDPEQDFSFLDEPEQNQRRDENKNLYQKKKEHFEKIAMLDYFEVRKGKAVYNKIVDKQGKEKWDFRQKGVDSLIAIDMLTKAFRGYYDVGVLVAGDSDFIEIVRSVKNSGVNIMGAYFEKNMPKELEHEFDRKFLLEINNLVNTNVMEL